MKNKIACFTGSSHTGKTTLLNAINSEYVKTVELSARPYLNASGGDYVEQSSESIQMAINVGSLITLSQSLLELQNPNQLLFFSRCAIDRLAYSTVLGVGSSYHYLLEKEIDLLVKSHTEVFYLPIEFPMSEKDSLRGNNEEVRQKVDSEIRNILAFYDIPHTTVRGSVPERLALMDEALFTRRSSVSDISRAIDHLRSL